MVEELIEKYRSLAKRIALSYASRHRGRYHPDECVAEAWFQLCILLYEKRHLYEAANEKPRMVGVFVKRRLIDYFERFGTKKKKFSARIEELEIAVNFDNEMMEYLEQVMPDDLLIFSVFKLIRGGIDFFDVSTVDPRLIQICQRLRHCVLGRIQRIKELQKAGIKVSREVVHASLVEDETAGTDNESSYNCGESSGGSDPEDTAAKRCEPETLLASLDQGTGRDQDNRS